MLGKLDKDKLLAEIRDTGIKISSINELMKMDKTNKDLIPILLKYIKQIEDEGDKQFLVRCLGVKGFTEATQVLLTEFENAHTPSYKWAIGNSLSIILDKSYSNDMLEIIQKKEHGIARQMVVIAIGKMKIHEAIPILLELLQDEDITGHVITALGNYKKAELIPYIKPFENHQVSWIRKEASKVIKKLSKN